MKIVVSIMNEQIDKDYSRYKNGSGAEVRG